jgi:hypothetical protein
MYVEVVDTRCIDFVAFEDFGNIMTKEYRITICNHLILFASAHLYQQRKLFVHNPCQINPQAAFFVGNLTKFDNKHS